MKHALKSYSSLIHASFLFGLVIVCLCVDRAEGALITVQVTGTIDVVEAPLGVKFSVGNTFEGVFTYGTTTQDVDATAQTGRYEGAIVSASFQVMDGASVIYGAAAVPDPIAASNVIGVFDEFPVPLEAPGPTDQIRVAVGSPEQWPGAPLVVDPASIVEDLQLTRVFFALLNDNFDHNAHNSDALSEIIAWDLNDYPDERGFFLAFKHPTDIGVTPLHEDFAVFGQITLITVPEPSAIGLLTLGPLGFLRRERRSFN